MPSRTDRNDFGPPTDAGRMRSFGWALLVHALLIGALTWGVNWKRSDTSPSFSAELWSSTVQEAAPRAAAPAPPPPPPATPPPPKPGPPVLAAPTPAPPRAPDVDIAVEEEKKRKLLKQKLEREEEDKQDKRQAAMDAKAEKLQREQAQAKQLALDAKKQDAAKLEAAKLEAAKVDAKNKVATAANAAAVEKQRADNLARMMGSAGASGDDASKGTAKVSSGPSSSYGGKVRAKVKPNIVFTDAIDENVKAEVEVRSALDGTITSQRLVKSSGNKAWDDAVIKAIVRTETMPRDTDGRVPPVMILEFRPRDQ